MDNIVSDMICGISTSASIVTLYMYSPLYYLFRLISLGLCGHYKLLSSLLQYFSVLDHSHHLLTINGERV